MSQQYDQLDAYKAAENRYLEIISPGDGQGLLPSGNAEEVQHQFLSPIMVETTEQVGGDNAGYINEIGESQVVASEIQIQTTTQHAIRHRRRLPSSERQGDCATTRCRSVGVECPLDPSFNNEVVQISSSDSDESTSTADFIGYDNEDDADNNEDRMEEGVYGMMRRRKLSLQEVTAPSGICDDNDVANGTNARALQERFESVDSDAISEQFKNADIGHMSTASSDSAEPMVCSPYEHHVEYQSQHQYHGPGPPMLYNFNQNLMNVYGNEAGNVVGNTQEDQYNVILDEGYTIQTIVAANANQRCIFYDNTVGLDVNNGGGSSGLCIVEVPYDPNNIAEEGGGIIMQQDSMNLQYADDVGGNLCLINDVEGHSQQVALQQLPVALVQENQSSENDIEEPVQATVNSSDAAEQSESLYYGVPHVDSGHEVIILSNEVIGVGNPINEMYIDQNICSNEQEQILRENSYNVDDDDDDDARVALNNVNAMLAAAAEEEKEGIDNQDCDEILVNSETSLTVSTEETAEGGLNNLVESNEYEDFYRNSNENTNPDLNTEEYMGVEDETEVETTTTPYMVNVNEAAPAVVENLDDDNDGNTTDSDVCIILDEKKEVEAMPPLPERHKLKSESVKCDYKANGLEAPFVETVAEEVHEDTQSVQSVQSMIMQANDASYWPPTQVLKCSSTTTEFPNSSNSNHQQQSTIGDDLRLTYPQRTPILKNTLAAETLDRKLAILCQCNPQLSVDEKIDWWNCNEEDDVSDVEDVISFDNHFESREALRREQMVVNGSNSNAKAQDFETFRIMLMSKMHQIKESMLQQHQQHNAVTDNSRSLGPTLQAKAKAQRMLQKRQTTDTPSSSTAENQQLCVSYQHLLHAASGGNSGRPLHKTLQPTVQETSSTMTLVPTMHTKYMTTNKRKKSCAIAVTRETQTFTPEKQRNEKKMESIGTSTTDLPPQLQPQPRSGTGVYVPMTSTGFDMQPNATFTSGLNTAFNFNINIPPPPFAKDLSYNNGGNADANDHNEITTTGEEDVLATMGNPIESANNEALFYEQNEFCNYLGLTGHATANAVAIAMQELANSSIARRSLRVRNQQQLERMRSDSSRNRKRITEIKSVTSSRANAGAASSEVLTTSSSTGLTSTTTAIHVPLLNTEEQQSCDAAGTVKETPSIQNSNRDMMQDIFCIVPANDPQENRKSAAIHDYLFNPYSSNNRPLQASSPPIKLDEHNELQFDQSRTSCETKRVTVGTSNAISNTQNLNQLKQSAERLHEEIQQRLKEAREAKPTIYIVKATTNDTMDRTRIYHSHRSLLVPPPSLGSLQHSQPSLHNTIYINKTNSSPIPSMEFTQPAELITHSYDKAPTTIRLKQIVQDVFATLPVVNDNTQHNRRNKKKQNSMIKSNRKNATLAQNEKRFNHANPRGLVTRSTTTMNSKQLRNRKISLMKSYCLTNETRSKRLMGGTSTADISTPNIVATSGKSKMVKKSAKAAKNKLSKTTIKTGTGTATTQSDTSLKAVINLEIKNKNKLNDEIHDAKSSPVRTVAGAFQQKNNNTNLSKSLTKKLVNKIKKRRLTMQAPRYPAKTVDIIPTNTNKDEVVTQDLMTERSIVRPPPPSLATERFLESTKQSFHNEMPPPAMTYPPTKDANVRETAGAAHRKSKAGNNLTIPSIKRLTLPSASQRNPLVSKNGKVLYIYYEQDMLIVVQEKLVSFWKYSKILNVLRKSGGATDLGKTQKKSKETNDCNVYDSIEWDDTSQESGSLRDSISSRGSSRKSSANDSLDWIHVGHVRRLTSDVEVMSPYSNRICVNNSTPLYVELRCHQLEHNRREGKLVSTYVNVYYYSEEDMCPKMHSIHLDAVPGESSGILYTTITDSRYFVMAWPQETMMGKVRTGLCKYSLTPALDTLASIREFKNMKHTIRHIECLGEDKLIGYGPSRITLWDHRSGDTVMCYDLCMNLGHNLGTMYYPSFDMAQNSMLVLYQHIQEAEDSPAELHIIACEVSCSTPSHRLLKVHKLPSPQFDKDIVSVNTGDHLIIKSKDNEEIWISNDDPQLLTFVASLGTKNFYCRNRSQVVEMSSHILNVNSIANHMLKLATRKVIASASFSKERKK